MSPNQDPPKGRFRLVSFFVHPATSPQALTAKSSGLQRFRAVIAEASFFWGDLSFTNSHCFLGDGLFVWGVCWLRVGAGTLVDLCTNRSTS